MSTLTQNSRELLGNSPRKASYLSIGRYGRKWNTGDSDSQLLELRRRTGGGAPKETISKSGVLCGRTGMRPLLTVLLCLTASAPILLLHIGNALETRPGWDLVAFSTSLKSDEVPKEDGGVSWNNHGCQEWHGPLTRQQVVSDVLTLPPPKGIAVTILRYKEIPSNMCLNMQNQLDLFFEPHRIDLLLLLDPEGVSLEDIALCLKLSGTDNRTRRVWHNLDGSLLTTFEYTSRSGSGRVYLADYKIPWPEYIQRNRSILNEPMPYCQSSPDYIQGTRFYSSELFGLSIMQQYEYWVKMDTDIDFNATPPFSLLHDMKIRGAVFGHTAAYNSYRSPCAEGIEPAVNGFIQMAGGNVQDRRPGWAKYANWTGPCSAGVEAFEMRSDQYYANFIIGRVAFWQSKPVRDFAKYINEFYPGFFRFRWGDQIFFHLAMGMFLGPDFRKFVADYTDLRCKHDDNCWFYWKPNIIDQVTKKEKDFCASGGYFAHKKGMRSWKVTYPEHEPTRGYKPYESKYRHNCPDDET